MNPPLINRLAAAAAAIAYGLAYAKFGYDAPWVTAEAPSVILLEGGLHLAALPIVLVLLQLTAWRYAVSKIDPARQAVFYRAELATHGAWLAAAAIGFAIGFSTRLTFGTLALHAGLQAACLRRAAGAAMLEARHSLAALFLVSGFAA